MWKKSKSNKVEINFKIDIPEYNDEQILDILKKRKYYQEEAVKIAMEEALNRKLINSEQDLFDQDFQIPPLKFGLFPKIERNRNKIKIRKSIARTILLAGLFPTIWGFLKLNRGVYIEGIILILTGVIWIFASARLIQHASNKLISALIFLSALSILYVGWVLFRSGNIIFMDAFIILILYSFLVYGLLFMRRLNSN